MASPVTSLTPAVSTTANLTEAAALQPASNVDFGALLKGRMASTHSSAKKASASEDPSDAPAPPAGDAASLFAALASASGGTPTAVQATFALPGTESTTDQTAPDSTAQLGAPASLPPTVVGALAAVPSQAAAPAGRTGDNRSPSAIAAIAAAPGQVMLRAATADGNSAPAAPAITQALAKADSFERLAANPVASQEPATTGHRPSGLPAAATPASFAALLASSSNHAEESATGTARPTPDDAAPVGNPAPAIPAPANTALAADPAARVETAFRHPSWGSDFGQQVVWIASQNLHKAELSLNPEHLGPIQIQLSLAGDQGSAVFVSPHAEVRDAVEAALPRLREMFADAGIQLGQASVSAESFRNPQDSSRESPARGAEVILGANSVGTSEVVAAPLRSGRGLVDTFA